MEAAQEARRKCFKTHGRQREQVVGEHRTQREDSGGQRRRMHVRYVPGPENVEKSVKASSGSCSIDESDERSDEAHRKSASCSGTIAVAHAIVPVASRNAPAPIPAPEPVPAAADASGLDCVAQVFAKKMSVSGVSRCDESGLALNVTEASVGSERLNMALGRVSR